MNKSIALISNNELALIHQAVHNDMRLDGRGLFDWRKLAFHFSPTDDASCTLVMGTTRILSSVSASLESPYPERPAEGNVRFNVEFSPMASPMFEPGRPGEEAIEVARLVDRALRGSRAIDQEALCVLAGRKVWSLRVDIHVLDHGGNLVDACCLSALGALMAFRKPETSVETGADGTMEVLVHPSEVKELTLHHLPVAVTYALFEGGNTVVVDPSLREEMAMQGCLTLIVNSSKEVCAVHKAGGVGVVSGQIMRCIRLAFEKVEVIIGALKAALETHAVKRVAARVKRHRQVQGFEPPVTAPLVQKETKVASTLQKLGIDTMDFDDEDVDNEEERMKDVSVHTALDPPPESERAPASSGKKPAKLRPPAQQPSPGGNKVATSSKRPAKRERGEVGLEGMESIAKAIAGVGKGEKEITSLSEAIKKKPTKK